jgi:beta-fructofuranosidase
MLQLLNEWLWDFWFAQDGKNTHVFYLKADRALKNPELRHWNVSIGHAVSQDLREWRVLPDALHPSAADSGAFDNYTTWTGSVIQHNGLWYMFYTGSMREEKGLVQRIGLATSPDLIHWEKHPNNPLIVYDPRWYEALDLSAWHDHAWRDPFVFYSPQDSHFHAFITARVKDGTADARGVIADARSRDLVTWEVCAPVSTPGEFGHMEVPQALTINGQHYLFFSVGAKQYSHARRARLQPEQLVIGTHYLIGETPLGPYHSPSEDVLWGDSHASLYSGKLVQDAAGQWQFLAFRCNAPDGTFIGELSDPMPVTVLVNGRLHVEAG